MVELIRRAKTAVESGKKKDVPRCFESVEEFIESAARTVKFVDLFLQLGSQSHGPGNGKTAARPVAAQGGAAVALFRSNAKLKNQVESWNKAKGGATSTLLSEVGARAQGKPLEPPYIALLCK